MLASVRSAVLGGCRRSASSPSRCTSPGASPATPSSVCPTPPGESRGSGSARPCCSSGLEYPQQRVTVNLAPASVRKTGAGLELAVALALTCAAGGLPAGALDGVGVLGELGLDGAVRPVVGTSALVDALVRAGVEHVVVPAANAAEAALVPGAAVRVARTLGELHACLKGEAPMARPTRSAAHGSGRGPEATNRSTSPTCAGSRTDATRSAIAAAGAHHLLMVGPPGVGKTMLARRLPTILAPLERDEALEVTRIHSAVGESIEARRSASTRRSASRITAPRWCRSSEAVPARVRPGEVEPRPPWRPLPRRGARVPRARARIDRASRSRRRVVRVSRASGTIEFPADFLLIACANPVPVRSPTPRIANAATSNACATHGGCPRRCSIASTSGSRSFPTTQPNLRNPPPSSPDGSRPRWPANGCGCATRTGAVTRTSRPAHSSSTRPSPTTPGPPGSKRAPCAASPEGVPARIRRVARTHRRSRGLRRDRRTPRRPRRLDARGPLVSRRPHRWERGDGFPIRDADLLDESVEANMPALLLGEGERADAFDAPRIGIVGTRAATPMGMADAARDRGLLRSSRDHGDQRHGDRHRRRCTRRRSRRRWPDRRCRRNGPRRRPIPGVTPISTNACAPKV